ncbi:MBL fold metallo-hydrolase [Deinococcus sp. KNUC1210]|uniref:MBL fold metallo-hydrolase n=1 Tax=Deinococcus sp. KNUC1210 TaxID=2917691 RepID=UPI001EF03949|nr:MBL fold metallo-hydrolase [Deinococcus sp. KNUC1210]ULH15207.1 MBL fold metallo-hydrolase [Deinococcus sp. KNUC1210]
MLQAHVLGLPSHDNALLVTADSGQRQTRLLLDCGAGVLDSLPISDILSIDHLLFSHFHMDHVGGFDAYFRLNFDRTERENHVWGPPGSIEVLSHRFQGYLWNLRAELRGVWHVHELDGPRVRSARFEAREGFQTAHDAGERPLTAGLFLQTTEVEVRALTLSHHGVSLGYLLNEPARLAVSKEALRALGLKGGPWLNDLKTGQAATVTVNGTELEAEELRANLLKPVPGDSLAYLSDFLLDEAELTRLTPLLAGVQTLYAEAQYAPEDTARAAKNHHTTVLQVAELARRAGAGQLQLLHLSRRYSPSDWARWLALAREVYPNTAYPAHWF